MFPVTWRSLIVLLVLFCLVWSEQYQYQAIIDSGSTGSRIYIYRYQLEAPLQTIEELDSKRVNPSLASFYNNSVGLEEHIQSLISFARRKIEATYHATTDISLKATAGLRTIPEQERNWIMNEVRNILKNSSFHYTPVETRVLTGGEEALFGLLATNIAFSNLTNKFELSLGAGDLGGSSQQVAFVIPPKTFLQSFFDWYVRPLGGLWTGGTPFFTGAETDTTVGNVSSKMSKLTNDISDACMPNFAVSFPVAPSGSVVDRFLAPFAALASSYSPAALLASAGWISASSHNQVDSNLSLQSDYFSSIYEASVTINIYARSMAGMGLVSAMNETFYYIAEMHERRRRTRQMQSQLAQSLEEADNKRRDCLEVSDAGICHSSLDLSDDNARYCHDKWDLNLSPDSAVQDHYYEHHQESIETNENNDGDLLYGEHASWLHALHFTDEIIENPCAPPGENLPYPDALSTLRWQGTGNFWSCTNYVRHLIETHALRDVTCMRQWQSQLPTAFITMDNFPKILQVLQLPVDQLNGTLIPAMIRWRGQDICQQPWTELQEVYPDFPAYRVQQACFAASFVYVLMKDVYGMEEGDDGRSWELLPIPTWRMFSNVSNGVTYDNPYDPYHDSTVPFSSSLAMDSGLPLLVSNGTSLVRFVAMDAHDSFTIGWPLGAAIVSAMNITYRESIDDALVCTSSWIGSHPTPAEALVSDDVVTVEPSSDDVEFLDVDDDTVDNS